MRFFEVLVSNVILIIISQYPCSSTPVIEACRNVHVHPLISPRLAAETSASVKLICDCFVLSKMGLHYFVATSALRLSEISLNEGAEPRQAVPGLAPIDAGCPQQSWLRAVLHKSRISQAPRGVSFS